MEINGGQGCRVARYYISTVKGHLCLVTNRSCRLVLLETMPFLLRYSLVLGWIRQLEAIWVADSPLSKWVGFFYFFLFFSPCFLIWISSFSITRLWWLYRSRYSGLFSYGIGSYYRLCDPCLVPSVLFLLSSSFVFYLDHPALPFSGPPRLAFCSCSYSWWLHWLCMCC